ncbi:MAG: hypothetical protein DRI84_01710 [Bacteroidetes bacterium]|nr:MAG: hypothetical protein DRI84_01710 [Bacteroidota bacterium]
MKKTFLVLGMAALMVTFTSCGTCDKGDSNEAAAIENADATDKCGEGKCGEGKCGGTDAEGEEQDHFSAIDTDGDGMISKEEFNVHATSEFSMKDKNEDGKITADECPSFEMLNKDGDDFISNEEFETGHIEMFNKMDKDADGSVSKEEMEAQMEAMKEKSGDEKCGEGKCGK